MTLQKVSQVQSHLCSYTCIIVFNIYWNSGFIIFMLIVLQIVSGIFLSLHYTSDINYAYYSVILIIREVNYG